METSAIFAAVGGCPLFAGAEGSAVLAALGEPAFFSRGEAICAPDDPRRAAVFIVSGTVEVFRREGTRRIPLNRLSRGAVFGVAALFGEDGTYVTEAVARTVCTVCFLTQERMEVLFAACPRIAVNYITFLSGRVRFLNARLAEYTAGDVTDRVRRYLSDHADEAGRVAPPGGIAGVARALGVGRSGVYRALDALEKEGVLVRREGSLYYVG